MTNGESPIAFFQTGSGPPLVAMGGVNLDHSYLRPAFDDLGEHMTVTYVDHRGSGASPPVTDPTILTHDRWAEDVRDVIDRLGHERVVLFGHSYGGFLALEFALAYPDRLDGLILCCTAPAFDYPEVVMGNAAQRGTPEQVELLQEAFGAPIESDERLKQVFLDVLSIYFRELRDEFRTVFSDGATYSAMTFNRGYFECIPHFNTVERLHEIAVPTLVLCGREDWICPPAQSQRLCVGLPDSRLVCFEKSGHFPFMEEKDTFTKTVSDWLTSVLPPTDA